MPRVLSEYAIYRGDTFLDLGTVPELAERFNVVQEMIRFWASPANHRRLNKQNGKEGNCIIAIKLEEEQD